jgi:hypothetical protein
MPSPALNHSFDFLSDHAVPHIAARAAKRELSNSYILSPDDSFNAAGLYQTV